MDCYIATNLVQL